MKGIESLKLRNFFKKIKMLISNIIKKWIQVTQTNQEKKK